jgi:hypothetical protein
MSKLEELLKDVVFVEKGPKVIFRWGFKVVEFQGEKVLEALTPEEYRVAFKSVKGREPTEEEVRAPRCIHAGVSCVSQGCSQVGGHCVHNTGIGFDLCDCSY